MVFNMKMTTPYLAECAITLNLISPKDAKSLSKAALIKKLNMLDGQLTQVVKNLEDGLTSPPKVSIHITKPVPVKIAPPEEKMEIDDTLSGQLSSIKAKYIEQVKEVPIDLPMSAKKKILTQIRKSYYNWYLEYIENLIVEKFGHYKEHRAKFLKGEKPTYTLEELHEICKELMKYMNVTVDEPALQSETIRFLTETRERKVKQQILRLFVMYQNYMELFNAYHTKKASPILLEKCLERIKDANLTGTVEKQMIGNFQYYLKKFEKL